MRSPPGGLVLLPLTGPWHLHHPRWNVVCVREALEALAPATVHCSALPVDHGRAPMREAPAPQVAPALQAAPALQELEEIALPWTVAPWAAARGIPLIGLMDPADGRAGSGGTGRGDAGWGDAPGSGSDQQEFRRHLAAYPAARRKLDELDRGLAPLAELLPQPLDLARLLGEVVPLLEADWRARAEAFGEGPATGWRLARARRMVQRWMETAAERPMTDRPGPGALLLELDLWPPLTHALDEAGLPWTAVRQPPPSAASRLRSLLDLAWRDQVPDVGGLLQQLAEVEGAEARFLEAQLLLARGEHDAALALLEAAAHGDFSQPYLLPGMLLARLGQLRDLAGSRALAMQAYRGALALAWAPAEAREAARAGLQAPFRLPGPPSGSSPGASPPGGGPP